MKNFYPRSPRGERPGPARSARAQKGNFYPRSPRGERLIYQEVPDMLKSDFYPRSPRGERHAAILAGQDLGPFLSTLPARGATDIGV